ncbi:MAG: NUDIX hydrolase [Lachnospiraceae bacterium]|nr:NUDIX hydrolase [Lachnospiraceae bacterium]MDE6625327.1 NUDIX hydrolase [Lachnospiraceae bacterium]
MGNRNMGKYKMSEEERRYLDSYDITQFDRPSVVADMAVFSIMGKGGGNEKKQVRDRDNYRKLPEKTLKILLIKRGTYPYKDCWALPGGFCQSKETVYETARRELYEETHVKNAYLNPCGIYGEPDRDPRGWIISHTFLALIDGEKCELRAGTDAWEARWFDISFIKKEKKKIVGKDGVVIDNEYLLQLTNSDIGVTNLRDCVDKEVCLSAEISEHREFKDYHETVEYRVVRSKGFAFDHAKIITCAVLDLRKRAEEDGKIVFDMMPELFTLTQLQRAFETILDKKLLVANFRRKMADYVVETKQIVEGAGHRPAKLFKRNLDTFYK